MVWGGGLDVSGRVRVSGVGGTRVWVLGSKQVVGVASRVGTEPAPATPGVIPRRRRGRGADRRRGEADVGAEEG